MQRYRIILVVDRGFGERLLELPKGVPIWITQSAVNAPAIATYRTRWPEGYQTGLTSFRDDESLLPDQLAARMIDTIDEHHGEGAHNPPMLQLTIIGTLPTELLTKTLEELGFRLTALQGEASEYTRAVE